MKSSYKHDIAISRSHHFRLFVPTESILIPSASLYTNRNKIVHPESKMDAYRVYIRFHQCSIIRITNFNPLSWHTVSHIKSCYWLETFYILYRQWAQTPLYWDKCKFVGQGAVSIRKTVLPGMAIPMLKIRRPNGRLIFNMEIAIRR